MPCSPLITKLNPVAKLPKGPEGIPAWFEAMNCHDLDALLKDYAENVTMVYPGDVDGVSGTFKGKATHIIVYMSVTGKTFRQAWGIDD